MKRARRAMHAIALVLLGAATTFGAPLVGCNEIIEIPDRATKPHVASCEGGACTCAEGFGDCDGDLENGCEVRFDDDPVNCGSCGHGCLGGECTTAGCGVSFVAWEELEAHQGPVAGDGLVYVVNVSTNRVMALGPSDTAFRDHGGYEGLSIGMKRNELGVFFASYPPAEDLGTGPYHATIHRVDASGVHTLAAIETGPDTQIIDFAVTEGAIWISGRNWATVEKELLRFDLASGARKLVTTELFASIDADHGHVYWEADSDLLELVDGGMPMKVIDATPGDYGYFVYGPGAYYGIDAGLVSRIDRATLAKEELPGISVWSVDPDGADLLILDRINGTVNRWPPGTATTEVLAQGMHVDEGDGDYYYVTSDERGRFWADRFGVYRLARP